MNRIIVVDDITGWPSDVTGAPVVSAAAYLAGEQQTSAPHLHVLNLCGSYRYQRAGYYVSLLAEARGHKVIPSLSTLQDLRTPSITRAALSGLSDELHRALARHPASRLEIDLRLGELQPGVQLPASLASKIHRHLPAPSLRVLLERRGRSQRWNVVRGRIVTDWLKPALREEALSAVASWLQSRPPRAVRIKSPRFEVAMLVDPQEPEPPSNEKALGLFERAFGAVGVSVDRIDASACGELAQYDALFIRQTTRVDDHTYRFARRAAAEGLVVVDDPVSIFRCTNKVYLAELLARHRVATPQTLIVHRGNLRTVGDHLGFPCVLKRPDSSFSQGVTRADDASHFREVAQKMLQDSDLLIAQRYMPTDFDWRVGLFGGEILYACKYFMARGHWQIIRRDERGRKADDGESTAVPLAQVPQAVLQTALRAARPIGDGLYGVDLKECDGKVVVVEVNDNPSIDHGYEDALLGQELYQRFARKFVQRIETRRGLS